MEKLKDKNWEKEVINRWVSLKIYGLDLIVKIIK
jgi:hypothetical protein